MRETPRTRRLRSDLQALEQLRGASTIFDFVTPHSKRGSPESYILRFRGSGLWRPANSDEVLVRHEHEVSVELGAEYPRLMPSLAWRTPIFHPNISSNGVVCLGGYGTHWAPSLNLGELCTMLWDIIRYQNYDVESPYNREAAHWVKTQARLAFPIDGRPIRDLLARGTHDPSTRREPPIRAFARPETKREMRGEVVVAEVIETDPDILFIE